MTRLSGFFWLHVRRALAWNLQDLPVTVREQAHLARRGIAEPVLQRYLTWRRSVLLILCVPVGLIALLTTFDILRADYLNLLTFGRLWLTFQILAPYAMPVAAVTALVFWSRQRLSRRLMAWGWLIAFVVPIFLFLIPAHLLFDFDRMPARGGDILMGIAYFLWLCVYLPIFATSIALGVQRACLRLKSLIPEATIPGLFLVTSAPVLPLVLLPLFVLLNQLAVSPLLIGGMFFLMASPLVYAVFGRTFLRPLVSAQERNQVRLAQLLSKILFWVGTALLLIYAMTRVWIVPNLGGNLHDVHSWLDHKTLLGFDEEHSLFRPWDWHIIRWLAVELLGRMLFTTIVVTDLFMMLHRSVWYYNKQLASNEHVVIYDHVMTALDRSRVGGTTVELPPIQPKE